MKISRRIVYIVVFFTLLLHVFESYATNEIESAERYNYAGALYREGKFNEAMSIYQELIDGGINNPDLYCNAANTAYRNGSLGKAILYLERALKLSPSDRVVIENLVYLNSIKKDNEPENSNVVLAFLAKRYNTLNVNSLALWSCMSFAIAMFFATGALFVRTWKRITLCAISILCGLLFFFSSGILIQKIHALNTVTEAIIMEDEAHAYSGPGTDNTHIFTIHEGTKVFIERSQDLWNLIRLKSGAAGWIQTELMEKI